MDNPDDENSVVEASCAVDSVDGEGNTADPLVEEPSLEGYTEKAVFDE